MSKPHQISPEERACFAGVYLLERMINHPVTFPLLLEGDDQHLETVLEWLYKRDYTEIVDKKHYTPTAKGRQVLTGFFGRYSDCLKTMDVYGAVDLETGDFAFENMFDFDDEALWVDYLNQDRWDDMRVAVASYKGLKPSEIIFMSFVGEGRFAESEDSWQMAITDPESWNEIEEICNSAIAVDELAYEAADGPVSGDDVLQDIIRQGAELNLALRKQEAEDESLDKGQASSSDDAVAGDEVIEEVVVEEYPVSYYEPYLDPLYVAPIWAAVWLL